MPKISMQQAMDNNLFGPVWHGTKQEHLPKIGDEGFRVIMGMYGDEGTSHGYDFRDFHEGIPAPVHHLGFGVYFTTTKSIAKKYAYGSVKGMKTYYLDVPRMEEINFGGARTMMKWWIENGYDFKPPYDPKDKNTMFDRDAILRVNLERFRATKNMTDVLKSQWDAVWYKGGGFRRMEDEQICVYDPSNIFEIDLSLSKGFDIGAKVRAKYRIARINSTGGEYDVVEAGARGIIVKKEPVAGKREEYPLYWAKRAEQYVLVVNFKPGGQHNVEDVDVEPLSQ